MPRKSNTSTALAKVGPDNSTTIVLQAIDETALAKLGADVKAELRGLEGMVLSDAEEVAYLSEHAASFARRYDAIEAERQLVVAPLNAKKNEVQAKYNAVLKPAEALLAGFRSVIGAFQLAESKREEALRLEAARAANAGDGAAMRTAIVAAAEAGPVKVAGSSTAFKWVVKRIVPDMLPDEGDNWIPNDAKFAALAAACPGEQEPTPVPGVVYEKIPVVGIRR